VEARVAATEAPLKADLTGGLGDIELDMAELAARAREEMTSAATDSDDDSTGTIAALPSPPRGHRGSTPPPWPALDIDPADLVVIVGAAELGPYGSSRTRFEMEVSGELSAAGVLELAWTTGLLTW
jgi:fatty acid synthase